MTEERLLALAGSIAEGAPVDWRLAEGEAAGDGERALVLQLRQLEDLVLAWRLGEVEPLPLPSRWGSLEVLEKLGSGGFGDVYRAWDARLRRDVALKLLRGDEGDDSGRGSLLLAEGQVLAQVRHPNVVTVFGADRAQGRVGLWMELVRGHTLAEELRREGAMSAAGAGSAGAWLSQALGAMHAAGVVHGDVKAQNVMLEGARYVLMDPGAGRAGTPAYLAPELRRGGRPTARSDVYAMGVLLHHMLTRGFPTDGALRSSRPDVPASFVHVVEAALDPDPARRYADGRALEVAIRNGFGEPPRDRRWAFIGALTGGLALAVALAALWPRGPAAGGGSTRPTVSHGSLTPAQRSLVESLDRLASLQIAMGSYAEAARNHGRAQRVYETALGPGHEKVADALVGRAWALRAVGSREEARDLYERALAIYETRLGPENPAVVATLGDLAALYEDMGAAARARPLEERARRILGEQPAVDPFVRPVGSPQSFDAEVERPANADRPYTIQATLEPSGAGEVALLVRASQPLFLYVLDEGPPDRVSLVFPLPGQEAGNPLSPGDPRRLPGERGWRRAGLGGSLVVIAGPERLLEFESELLAERVPRAGAALERVPLSPKTQARLQQAARVDASARLFEAARPAPEHLEIVRGLWIRRVDLGR